jgi:cytochrome c biogenesis protein CcmG/thiol:disulfide interchange protein DsbE
MSKRTLLSLSLAGAAMAGLVILAAAAVTPPKVREVAPEFALKDSSGAEVSLSDYKGKVVLLNFWATWCAPCRVEIPWFIEFQDKYEDRGLAIVGVSMDEDGWEIVQPYTQRMHINYQVLMADPAIAEAYGGLEALPETIMIDRNGRIAARHQGLTDKSEYEAEVVQLIGE